MASDDHFNNLKEICRLCGQKWKDGEQRNPISKMKVAITIRQALSIDVQLDVAGVQPDFVCHTCDRKLVRWRKKHSKSSTKPLMTGIETPSFMPHEEGNCHICHRPENLEPTALEVTELQISAEAVAKAHGFITWKGDEHQYIFVTLDKTLCASRAVIIFPNSSWRIQVLDIDVGLHVNNLPDMIKTEHLSELFRWATMPFCIGSPDFLEQASSSASFKDRTGQKVVGMVDTKFKVDGCDSTIRSSQCEGITRTNSQRCPPCAQFRNDLFARRNEAKKRSSSGASTSHARNDLMDKETLGKKTSALKKENVILKRQVKNLEQDIAQIMESQAVGLDPAHSSELATIFQDSTIEMESLLPPGSPQRLLWEQQEKFLRLKDSRQMRWHPTIIKWCIALFEKSPATYKTIRQSNFLKLPHHNTLFKYTHFTDARSGINPDILREVAREANLGQSPEHERNVSLIFDEMKIKNSLVYSQRSGKICGFTEMGDINDEISRFERELNDINDPVLASYVLVVMVRGLFSKLKKAVAWYPCTGFTSTQLFHTMWEVVEKVEYAGFYVRAFVSDGASPNRKFYSIHGDSNSGVPTYCTPNIVDPSRNIYFICDVPHLIKTTRNCWENSGWNCKSRNLMFRGKPISWVHLLDTFEWDMGAHKDAPWLRMLFRLTPDHLHLTPSLRMRVYLAAQVLSSTVAKAMVSYMDDTQHYAATSTVYFLDMMDKFFDIMNVSNQFEGNRGKDTRKPFTSMDDPRFKWLTNDFLGFLDEWQQEGDKIKPKLKADEKRRLCLSQQTLDGLRITVYSFVELAPILLSLDGVGYFLSEKLSQDYLEEYFSKHRGRGGSNENPSAFIFGHQFNSLHVSASQSVRATLGMCRNTNREEDGSTSILTEDPLPKRQRTTKDL